jgi:large subunit ribosomal protein L1
MARLTKKRKQILEAVDIKKLYSPSEAVDEIKKASTARFDETIEIAFCLGINPKHADQQVRTTVTLPEGTGHQTRVVVVAKGENIQAAKDAGADEAGAEDILDKIQDGWFEFDVLIATQDMMGKLSRLGRVLGPKKLMPNPKAGTVIPPSTESVEKTVKEFKAGKVEFRNDRHGNVHVAIGKASFENHRLMRNVAAIVNAIQKAKPSAAKGQYIKNLVLTSTMGPGLKLDAAKLNELSSID